MSSEETETDPPALTHSDLPLWKQIARQNKSEKRVQEREKGEENDEEKGIKAAKKKKKKKRGGLNPIFASWT